MLALPLSLLLLACGPASWRNAERAIDSGDMVNAVRYSTQTLREKPGYEEALDFLNRELPRIYDDFYSRAQRAERAGDWDEAFRLYDDIQVMSDAVRALPPQQHSGTKQMITLPTRDVDKEHQVARENAAEKHYQAGLAFERQGISKGAAKAFTRALDYIKNYRDAAQRYEKNRQAAVKRIAVMAFENLSGKEYFGAIGTVLADRLITEAMTDPKNLEFMEFVTRERIAELIREQEFAQSEMVDPTTAAQIGKVLGIHAFVFGKITSISTDYPPDVLRTYEEKDEISQGKDKPKKKVSAMVTVVTRTATAKLASSYQIIDVARGSIVKSGISPRVELVEIKFGRYRGDKEALSYMSRQICAVKESFPPPDDELVNRATESAARDLAREIASFFR